MEILGVIGHGGQLLFLLPGGFLIVLLYALLILMLPVIALIDILRSDFNGDDKIICVLIVLFLPILGSILYFIFGTSRKIRR
jgi:hypothetical protein